jgi:hypothetical protein
MLSARSYLLQACQTTRMMCWILEMVILMIRRKKTTVPQGQPLKMSNSMTVMQSRMVMVSLTTAASSSQQILLLTTAGLRQAVSKSARLLLPAAGRSVATKLSSSPGASCPLQQQQPLLPAGAGVSS